MIKKPNKTRIAVFKRKGDDVVIAEKSDYEIVDFYSELERLKADCNAGKIDLIIASDLTVFCADFSEGLRFIWEMQMHSPPVHVRLDTANIDTREPQSLLYCMVFHYVLQERRGVRGEEGL